MRAIDFYYSGARRRDAIKLLRAFYPQYSPARKLLYFVNQVNMLWPRVVPRTLSMLAPFLREMPLPSQGTRAILLHKINQNGRAYVFDQSQAGATERVTKVEVGVRRSGGLQRERAALADLGSRQLEFLVPRVIAYSAGEELRYLSVTAVPATYELYDKSLGMPHDLIRAIAKLRSPALPTHASIDSMPWFQRVASAVTNRAIRDVADGINGGDEFRLVAAHCDLASTNVFFRPTREGTFEYAVIDWENFSDEAPELTDEVGFWLGARHRDFKGALRKEAGDIATAFLQSFGSTDTKRRAAVLALLYLAEVGLDLAQNLCGVKR